MQSKLLVSITLLFTGISTALMASPVQASTKKVAIPKALQGNWVNNIEYGYRKGKFYRETYLYTQVTKHYVVYSKFQSDAYGTKIVSFKRIKNSRADKNYTYRLKATDITMLPVKKHTFHYIYMRRITINKKHFLSVAYKIRDLDKINSIFGNAKDNGLEKDFETPKK